MRNFFFLLLLIPFIITEIYGASVSVTGTITYLKVIYSRPTTGLGLTDQSERSELLTQATVTIITDGTTAATATTDDSGVYSFANISYTTSFNITVSASNASIQVGSDSNGSTITNVYQNTITEDNTSQGSITIDHHISKANNSGAFNIFKQLHIGQQWFATHGYTFTRTIKAVWPNSLGTFFDQSAFIITLLGVSSTNSDPDEFDDDIILHEFGHMAMEEFSLDHSEGGFHTITSNVDLRLAWSEGVASYISCAIRNDPVIVDSISETTTNNKTQSSSYDNSKPSSSHTESTNELAVTYVLWQANQLDGAATNVLSTLASFKSLPANLNSEQISLDTFHDLYKSNDLSSFYSNRSILYQTDSVANNTSSSPFVISNPAEHSTNDLSFFPDGDRDYFSFQGAANALYTVQTQNPGNGVLTSLRLYKGSVSASNLVSSNDQINNAVSDRISGFVVTLPETTTYIIEAFRFNSSTQNYGLGGTSYSRTAGRYGSYSLRMVAGSDLQTPTTTSTVTTSSGGGGGGCFLKHTF